MARDAIANLCSGRTAVGDELLSEPLGIAAAAEMQTAMVGVLDALASQIGDPSLAQLSPLPLLLLRYLEQTGLNTPEQILSFPVNTFAEAIRANPAILVRSLPLADVIDR